MSKPVADEGVQGEGGIQGEGDYIAGRRFQEAEQAFVKTGPIDEKAREAAEAIDGPEGEELEEARLSTGEGDIHATRKAHTEADRDHTLEDTFPASDPPSASPGAD